jgi:hypothetical protein
MSSAFLESLSGDDAVRYRVFLDSTFSPEVIESLLINSLPPIALQDASSRKELLIALATSARVFAIEVAEGAVALRATTDAVTAAAPVSPGQIAAAWRRRTLTGYTLPTIPSVSATRAIDTAASEIVKAKRAKR